MLTYQRQNFHHSKLPEPGTIGRIISLSTINPCRKCIVIAYPRASVQPGHSFLLGALPGQQRHTPFQRHLVSGGVT